MPGLLEEQPDTHIHTTILVIDDELDAREAVGDALGDEGYTVLLAENGKKGLEILPALKRPCCVIVDINMPIMNGVEFYRAIRAEPTTADIPVLISTADPARAPRGVPLIKKPMHLDRLLAAVAALLPKRIDVRERGPGWNT